MAEKSTQPGISFSAPVAVALTTPNRFVKLSSGNAVLCGLSGSAAGVIENKFDVGEQAAIVATGIVLVEVGSGGVTENSLVTSDANGKAILVAAVAVAGTATLANAVIPSGATPVTSSGAQPTLTMTQPTIANAVTGGLLPVVSNGKALDTVSEGGFARILLAA